MRLHRQEKLAQEAARTADSRIAYVGWRYGAYLVRVRAKRKLVGYEMRYWLTRDGEGQETQITRKELIQWMKEHMYD